MVRTTLHSEIESETRDGPSQQDVLLLSGNGCQIVGLFYTPYTYTFVIVKVGTTKLEKREI